MQKEIRAGRKPLSRRQLRTIVPAMVVIAGAFFFFQQKQHQKPALQGNRAFLSKVSVGVSVAGKASIRDSFAVSGLAEAFRDVGLYSETGGIVRSSRVEVGRKVSAGEILMKVDDDLQASALRKARADHEQARRDAERYRNLHAEGAIPLSGLEASRLRLEEADAGLVAAEKRYRDTGIRAPISGVITSKLVESGEMVQPGMKVATIVDLSKLKVRVSVPEKQVMSIAEGGPVRVTTDLYGGKVFRGTIASISRKATGDHTFQVEVLMDNPKETPFRAGIFARAAFVGSAARDGVVVPRRALVGSVREPAVYVVRNGRARLQRLVVGQELQNSLEVTRGIAPGDSVVTSGQNELAEGTAVSVNKRSDRPGGS